MWSGKWSSIKDEPKVVTADLVTSATPPINNNHQPSYYDQQHDAQQLIYDAHTQNTLYAPPIGENIENINKKNLTAVKI